MSQPTYLNSGSAAPGGEPCLSAEEREEQALAEKMRTAQKEQEEIVRVLHNLREAAGSLRAQRHDDLQQLQGLAVELAVAIASRLVHNRIEAGEYPLETLVRKVVERLEVKQPVQVYLHPEDLVLLQRRVGEDGALFPPPTEVELVGDPAIPRGDIRAQAGDISVLADVEEQLTDIRRRLLETLPAASQKSREVPELRPFPEDRQSA